MEESKKCEIFLTCNKSFMNSLYNDEKWLKKFDLSKQKTYTIRFKKPTTKDMLILDYVLSNRTN